MNSDSPSFSSMPRAFPPMNPAGRPFVLLFAVISIGLGFVAQPLFWLGFILTIWCAAFFRDPERVPPTGEGLIVSPADGVVLPLVESPPPDSVDTDGKPMQRISIFMNVFDVHVNRIPCDGKIEELSYEPGAFFNASLDKASEDNERMIARMTAKNGRTVVFVQIAGLVARRILCYLDEGQTMQAGERFGMIRFGSRVDVYAPLDAELRVRPGQRAVAGETVLAVMSPKRGVRRGRRAVAERKPKAGEKSSSVRRSPGKTARQVKAKAGSAE